MIARLLMCLLALIWVEVSHAADSIDVSVIQLIATPERFDGKRVRVIGFLNLEFEGNALYVHREDYDQAIAKNALWIDTTPQKTGSVSAFASKNLSNQYVIVEGVFDAKNTGHKGSFSGAIKEISRADRWQNRAEIEKIIQGHKP